MNQRLSVFAGETAISYIVIDLGAAPPRRADWRFLLPEAALLSLFSGLPIWRVTTYSWEF